MTPLAAPAPASSSMLTRVAVGISIGVHVVAVLLSLGYAGAGLFEATEPEAVPVSLVTPDEVVAPEPEPIAQKPDPTSSQFDLRLSPLEKPVEPPSQQPPELSRQQAAPTKPSSDAKAASQKQATTRTQPAQATPPQPPQPAYTPAQPDISTKYQVDLGLKELPDPPPQLASAQDGKSDFDAQSMTKADLSKSSVADFRAKLKQCMALPAQISPDDKVVIVLRATFTPNARLASAPVLIEASASAKGPALMQAAIAALQNCQPHTALPAESYAEWRVLDLRFTPLDFRSG